MRTNITNKTLQKLKPKNKAYFLRSNSLRGFAVKINPSGSIKYIIETKYQGKNYRKTIGSYPLLSLKEAKEIGINTLQMIHSGDIKGKNTITLEKLLDQYTSHVNLKPRTIQDYSTAISCYLSDWMNSKVSEITKEMVENRFYLIRDKGWNNGKPTYSQATKVMRILSALLNHALADDILDRNPVLVLNQKRVSRAIVKKTAYLPKDEARKLLDSLSTHPIEVAVALMLHTGLRKNECLSLRWTDVSEKLIRISNTKNHREHLIPITYNIQETLNKLSHNSSPYVFPSPKSGHYKDTRKTLKRIEKKTGIAFQCHDLRRTFATRASEVGIDYLMIKRLLNHKTTDITAQYIQWDSKQNLQKMKEALELIIY